jgi:hypothetical protein
MLLAVVLALTSAWEYNNPYAEPFLYMDDALTIDQDIDHFNYNSKATFKQRYYVLKSEGYKAGGPAFLYIGGEGPLNGIKNPSWTTRMANETGGIVFALEHRFYG